MLKRLVNFFGVGANDQTKRLAEERRKQIAAGKTRLHELLGFTAEEDVTAKLNKLIDDAPSPLDLLEDFLGTADAMEPLVQNAIDAIGSKPYVDEKHIRKGIFAISPDAPLNAAYAFEVGTYVNKVSNILLSGLRAHKGKFSGRPLSKNVINATMNDHMRAVWHGTWEDAVNTAHANVDLFLRHYLYKHSDRRDLMLRLKRATEEYNKHINRLGKTQNKRPRKAQKSAPTLFVTSEPPAESVDPIDEKSVLQELQAECRTLTETLRDAKNKTAPLTDEFANAQSLYDEASETFTYVRDTVSERHQELEIKPENIDEKIATILEYTPSNTSSSISFPTKPEETQDKDTDTKGDEIAMWQARLDALSQETEAALTANARLEQSTATLERRTEKLYKKIGLLDEYATDLDVLAAERSFATTPDINAENKSTEYPPLAGLEKWAKQNLNGRVLFSRAAFNAAAQSSYERPDRVYDTLRLLANAYYQQRTAGNKPESERTALRRTFSDALKKRHLSIGGSLSPAGNGKFWERYTTTFKGDRIRLDQHIAHGNSRDPRFCMRIYFGWSEKHNAVVVGHLPGHLPNRLS